MKCLFVFVQEQQTTPAWRQSYKKKHTRHTSVIYDVRFQFSVMNAVCLANEATALCGVFLD